ncbi:MAG: 4-(cytidine 5'-diphospho)-2-C-methyl-D-erythritol kinase [Campylobacterota bacterium]|nr:4-(cytidine 5'-diphospho)-2-C-methyl-D-erythritol kinase [Campylobacterota bacterium]
MDNVYTKLSYAKVNIFLKIAGKRGSYHELVSRFVRVKNLYDLIKFEKGTFRKFTLEGDFGCETKQNTIYKAYVKLLEVDKNIKELFENYKVVVEKNIPEFAGLGGGSSNCATFIIMVNEIANLGLSKDQLSKIAETIGADVPFFIYEYDSANVTGIGEKVEPFDEEILDIKTFTPKIECNTGKIFTSFRDKYYNEISKEEANKLLNMKSIDILNSMNINSANDLYLPALDNYPQLLLENYNLPKNSFFSGSGSSFFYIIKR